MRTSLHFGGGGVEQRTRLAFECADCGVEYRPRVASRPGLMIALGVVAILLVTVTGLLHLADQVPQAAFLWAKLAATLIAAAIAWMATRLQNRLRVPRFYSPSAGRAPEYGEIVPGCPRCRSTRLRLPGTGEDQGSH